MATSRDDVPLLHHKRYDEPPVFQPANLLREARRQKQLPDVPVPPVCLLEPNGDIVHYLASSRHGHRHPGWACYHTDMWETDVAGTTLGVVGMAVGAPFAVLVAEQLHVSGAEFVVSITSAGQVQPLANPRTSSSSSTAPGVMKAPARTISRSHRGAPCPPTSPRRSVTRSTVSASLC